MVTCNELEQLLEPYLDGEFGAEERVEVEAHLATCASCSQRVHTARSFRSVIRARAREGASPAPASLRNSVLAGVGREARRESVGYYAKLSTAALVLAAAGGLVLHYRHPPRERFLAEAAAWHAKDLPFEIDRASDEKVEAWFGGKLDHRVAVPHLSHATLAGARLSNVLDRPAAYISYDAALVQGQSPRRVGVFVFDDAQGEVDARPLAEVQVVASRGYNVALWREGEIVYELVSDLDATDIRRLLQQREAVQDGATPLGSGPAQVRLEPATLRPEPDPHVLPPPGAHPGLDVRPASLTTP